MHDLLSPPSRFFDVDAAPPAVALSQDINRLTPLPSPGQLLAGLTEPDRPAPHTRRTLASLQSWFMVCEDRQNRLEARAVEALAHQASLVRFILDHPELRRVLIGDEVGLGKTVEAGLIIQELLRTQPRLRVMYLAPARLVANVRKEFDRLGLRMFQWSSDPAMRNDLGRDDMVVVSIHRAAHENNADKVVATQPWDVLIVDECHHLSNYDPDGWAPRRQFALVQNLIERQAPGSRVILMSGTPHQGHPDRFTNLLRLLSDDYTKPDQAAGRVIFRTKEDVLDWDGNPLFPKRQVNQPRVFSAPPGYRDWMRGIYACFQGGIGGTAAQRRASGWRAAQALQWAASSVHAGIGYLVRLAMRNGWTPADQPTLAEALAVIRPYRLGSVDEPVNSLFERILGEITLADLEDQPEGEEERWQPEPATLARLLRQGVELLNRHGTEKWDFIRRELLDEMGEDQVVLFAQPVETVCALSRWLSATYGTEPSIIIGGQSDSEREEQVNRFWSRKSRFLIGSRAAYEGFNLQCAHRVIHVDVPWNPMDLEQRVGRVHRFGSRRTIIADTVVMEGSREADAYGTAFNRLREIAKTLAPDDNRMQMLFSRVMNLVPPDDLVGVLVSRQVDGLSDEERRQVAALVDNGFRRWTEFHERFRETQSAITRLDPGEASWDDVAAFCMDYLKGTGALGFSALGFQRLPDGSVIPRDESAKVVSVPAKSGDLFLACAETAGRTVVASDGRKAIQAGLNHPTVNQGLRGAAFPDFPVGAGWVRLSRANGIDSAVEAVLGSECVLMVVGRLSVIRHEQRGYAEHGRQLRGWVVQSSGNRELDSPTLAACVRALRSASVRVEAPHIPDLVAATQRLEDQIDTDLRRPTDLDRSRGVRHAVYPIAAIHIVIE